jgi:drug/metabolite transporter (DMT)-like permease
MRWRSVVGLLCCGALFGLSYVLVRVTVPGLGPVAVTAARTLIGGLTLLGVAGLRGQPVRARGWRSYAVLGLLAAALPFSLVSLCTLTLGAGTSAVLNASAPMFALAIDAAGRRRWPGLGQLAGLCVAIAGVFVVMSARGVHVDRSGLVGVAAGLGGAAIFAYAGFFAARRFADAAPLAVAAGQQFAGGLLLVPLLAVLRPHATLDTALVAHILVLGLLGSALAFLIFYWLIAREGPVWTANVNLLVPVCGVLWGRALLGEPVPLVSVAGMVLTVGGLALILRPPPPGFDEVRWTGTTDEGR